MEMFIQDLRFAVRTLRRRPLFTVVAIVTLGMAIGGASAMFSVVDGVLLTKSQYRDSDRLMSIWQRRAGYAGYTEVGEIRLTYRQHRDLIERGTAFEGVAVYAADWGESTLLGGPRPELVNVGAATASLLPVLGVSTVLGRWFLPEEEGNEAGDRALVTVLGYDNWVNRYGADREILGRTVVINDNSFQVVGVLPPGFRMQWLSNSLIGADNPDPRDFWVPVGSPGWREAPGAAKWEAVGRLAPGVTREKATVESGPILMLDPQMGPTEAIVLPRAADEVRGLGSPLLLLFGATGILLLIACGNVAALSLGEARGRSQEVATRAAIGAGRGRIVRLLLTESVLVGLLGSLLGALLAAAGTGTIVALAPPIPRMGFVEVNPTVLGFSALLGTLSGVVFGVAPAIITSRNAVGSILRAGGRTGSRRHVGLGRSVLAGEIGLTVVLLVVGGLLIRSLDELMSVELGFDPANVVTVGVGLPGSRYNESAAAGQFLQHVLTEIETIPGVISASAANDLPFPGRVPGWGSRRNLEDSSYVMPQGYHVVPGHLDFMGIELLEGRGILPTDDAEAERVMVVGESLARALWGDRSPVGQTMFYPPGQVRVVGVAADVRQSALQDTPPLTFYVPFVQHSRSKAVFAVRTRRPPAEIIPALREAVWRVDADLAISGSGSLEGMIEDSAHQERFRTLLMSLFALLATLLAAVGIMGDTARAVSQRTRELGIRKALGAQDNSLLALVIGSAAITGALGVAIGLGAALWTGPLLGAFLFGVETFDLPVYAGVGTLFIAVTVVASYLPARRLLKVNPTEVLSVE